MILKHKSTKVKSRGNSWKREGGKPVGEWEWANELKEAQPKVGGVGMAAALVF